MIITLASQKGGVAKTTTAVGTASVLASRYPGRILCIDLDANNNMTDMLGRNQDTELLMERNVYHALMEELPVGDCIHHSDYEGIDLMPATPSLSKIGSDMVGSSQAIALFPSILDKIINERKYQYVIIDSPPSQTLEFQVSIFAADYVLVPVQPQRWSLQAFMLVKESVDRAARHRDRAGKAGPQMLAIASKCTEKDYIALKESFTGVSFCSTFIHKNKALENASSTGIMPKIGSSAMEPFMKLADEIETWRRS